MSILHLGLCDTLNQNYLDILRAKSINRSTDFVSKDVEDIVQLTGIPYKDVVSIRNVILAKYGAISVAGHDLYNSVVSSSVILSTGATSIDEVLDGGLYAGEVTEIVGDISAGKTQLCFSVCVTAAAGSNKNVLYVDTGRAFSASRLKQMIQQDKHATEVEDVLSRISCCDAFSIFDIFSVIDDIRDQIQEGTDPLYAGLKLVVIDNVASVVYPFLGGGTFSDSQGLIANLGQKLKSLAVEYSLAVLVANNVVGGENGPRTASLGRVWSHVPHVRLLIGQENISSEGQKTAIILKNCRGPTQLKARFQILGNGQVK